MQKSFIYIDTITKSQVTATGNFVTKSSDYLRIERGQWQIVCIQFVRREEDDFGVVTITPQSLDLSDAFLFVADSDFNDEDSLMLKSFQSTLPFDEADPESNRFNIEGDWIDGGTADPTQGQMSIRVNADTEKFKTVVGNRQSVSSGLYINIKQYIGGLSNPSNVAWFNFTALNTIRDWGEPEELPPQGTVIVPFISSYLKKPFEFQFSADGVEWHDTQADSDVYYRQRIEGIDAVWGEPIEMKGIPGKVVDTTATAPTLAVNANTVYIYQKALTHLTISSVDISVQETTIYFTAGSTITVSLPASVKTIGSMSFDPDKSYVISIKDGIAVSAEVN